MGKKVVPNIFFITTFQSDGGGQEEAKAGPSFAGIEGCTGRESPHFATFGFTGFLSFSGKGFEGD